MPTGYTYPVIEGKITEFSDFALSCARAFGALITMRDDPHDAPIPETFEPSDYSAKKLEEAKSRLAELNQMTVAAAEAAASAAFEAAMKSHQEYEDRETAGERRLETMLAKVKAWTPPTANHVEMKNFMVEQLTISKRGSYRSPVPTKMSGKDWLVAEIEKAHRDIGYHAAEHAKEVERAAGRTEWVRQLRGSLST